jgi:hypothetical protein
VQEVAVSLQAMQTLDPDVHQQLQQTTDKVLVWVATVEDVTAMDFSHLEILLKRAGLAHAKPWETVVAKLKEIQITFKAVDQEGRVNVTKCGQAFLSAEQCVAGLNSVDSTLMLFKEKATKGLQKWKDELKTFVAKYLTVLLDIVAKKSLVLGQVAAGGPHGTKWHGSDAANPGDEGQILETFKKSLNLVDRAHIEQVKLEVTGALEDIECCLAVHRASVDNIESIVEGLEATVKTAKTHVASALTTWGENMLCQVLIRGGKHAKARIETYTSQLSGQAGQDWAKLVHPDIAVLAKKLLQ